MTLREAHAKFEAETTPKIECGVYTRSKSFEMWLVEKLDTAQDKLADSQAETAACLEFLDVEMGWEYFRAERIYGDNEPGKSQSSSNAVKLATYLKEKGHGIAFRKRLAGMKTAIEEALKALDDASIGKAGLILMKAIGQPTEATHEATR